MNDTFSLIYTLDLYVKGNSIKINMIENKIKLYIENFNFITDIAIYQENQDTLYLCFDSENGYTDTSYEQISLIDEEDFLSEAEKLCNELAKEFFEYELRGEYRIIDPQTECCMYDTLVTVVSPKGSTQCEYR